MLVKKRHLYVYDCVIHWDVHVGNRFTLLYSQFQNSGLSEKWAFGTLPWNRPQCVLCAEVLANDSMKPCKLKRHLDTKHSDLKEEPVDKRDGLQQQRTTMSKHSTVSKQCLEASYVVAHRIAKLGKPHTIAETLILTATQDV